MLKLKKFPKNVRRNFHRLLKAGKIEEAYTYVKKCKNKYKYTVDLI